MVVAARATMPPPVQDPDFRKAFGDRVRELRKRKGWTQKELAARLGVKTPQLTKYETGFNAPTLEKVVELAEILDVSLDYLLLGDRPDAKPLADLRLLDRFRKLEAIAKEDRDTIVSVIDAVLLKSHVKGTLDAEARPRRRKAAGG